MKRLFDACVSAIALVAALPLLAGIAIAIVVDSGRPVFFLQERVGLNFRLFKIIKFRSMQTLATGSEVTVAGDLRVTRVGRILRLLKLDELPQLWNVLTGDMSIVGPRPEVPHYVSQFRDAYRRVLTIRPGITDMASIHFRHEESILAAAEDSERCYVEAVLPLKLKLAEQYVSDRSCLLDLEIIMKTVLATLRVSSIRAGDEDKTDS